MSGLKYWRTFGKDGSQRTHLEGIGDSYTLCGFDIAGDDSIHGKDPEELQGESHRITCEQCQQIISLVLAHTKRKPKGAS